MYKSFRTPPGSPAAPRTVVGENSERVASTPKRKTGDKLKDFDTGNDEEMTETGPEVEKHVAAEDKPAVTGDIDTDKETDAGKDGEHGVVAARLDGTVSSQPTLLFDDDSDGELSEDPAPYADHQLTNRELAEYEKFTPHPTDPTKINATFRMKMPDGNGWYVQKDVIPEVREAAQIDKYEESDCIFPLSLEGSRVPRKYKARNDSSEPRWVKTTGNRWERTYEGRTDVFVPKIVHRRFNARTHVYEQIYFSQPKLDNIDPNDKEWVYMYNKWLDQIMRRHDVEHVENSLRERWSQEEICAMYTAFNAFFHVNGIDAYAHMSKQDLQNIVDQVNASGHRNCALRALREQMESGHGRKNPSLAYLREHLPLLEEYMEAGGVISQEERFPENFIPQEEFPKNDQQDTWRRPSDTTRWRHKTKKLSYKSIGTQTGEDVGAMVDRGVNTDEITNVNTPPPPAVTTKRKRAAFSSTNGEKECFEIPVDQSKEGKEASGGNGDQGSAEASEADDPDYKVEIRNYQYMRIV
ncbi:hypothetical protein A1F96_10419 [Pyrenophora tritici-repentis]|uniref:Uncharacterized protein n=1 Tax=Pyrenophora tritici-repentis TaxID=45151 RepID=A0A2W1HMF6_9PLEO|nr:hypothetical protein A1F99_020050 [Pyrenophora tritici-repentis]KAF7577879.1 hypothetical protein PtrM4_021190 [Pyrenophora tritici-repentis]KAI1561076.1 hypothetical protein PtrEW4_010826 [Pyrenophora tritici-repentis]PZC89207.1 hypothetical protein A1F95_10458 [Pyrenophora tritici-repentis]PZD23245.1 hypothetical protein A1F96_10419 [Pyrenophora tritici-repentis]